MLELLLAIASGVPIIAAAGVASHLESKKHAAHSGPNCARTNRRIHRRPGKSGTGTN